MQCCSAAKFLAELLANNVFAHVDREVKKANRDLSHLLSTMETPMSRLEVVQKKYTELLQDMKRTERDHIKAKKRGDQLQKEKDAGRTELNRVTTVKDKLEKLSRDVTKENKKLKVSQSWKFEWISRKGKSSYINRRTSTGSKPPNLKHGKSCTIGLRGW